MGFTAKELENFVTPSQIIKTHPQFGLTKSLIGMLFNAGILKGKRCNPVLKKNASCKGYLLISIDSFNELKELCIANWKDKYETSTALLEKNDLFINPICIGIMVNSGLLNGKRIGKAIFLNIEQFNTLAELIHKK